MSEVIKNNRKIIRLPIPKTVTNISDAAHYFWGSFASWGIGTTRYQLSGAVNSKYLTLQLILQFICSTAVVCVLISSSSVTLVYMYHITPRCNSYSSCAYIIIFCHTHLHIQLDKACTVWSGTQGAFTNITDLAAINEEDGSCLYGHISVERTNATTTTTTPTTECFRRRHHPQDCLQGNFSDEFIIPICTFEAACGVSEHECRCLTEAEANGGPTAL